MTIAFWHWYNVHLAPGRFPMQWTFLTGKLTREHQIEEHFLEYLRNLVEIPQERETLLQMLNSRQLVADAEDEQPLTPLQKVIAYTSLALILLCTLFGLFTIWMYLQVL